MKLVTYSSDMLNLANYNKVFHETWKNDPWFKSDGRRVAPVLWQNGK
jgi:hypothetical protein